MYKFHASFKGIFGKTFIVRSNRAGNPGLIQGEVGQKKITAKGAAKNAFSISVITFGVCLVLLVANPVCAQSTNKKLTDGQVARITDNANKQIPFVENKGQWPGNVLYRADVAGGQMLATPEGMLVGLFDRAALTAASRYDMRLEQIQNGHLKGGKIEDLGPPPVIKGFGWRLNFIGGSKAVKESILKEDMNTGISNYLTAERVNSAVNVHSYNVITYTEVYPGISVKYYTTKDGNLENDIIIKPGANAAQINMQVEGPAELKMDANGGLVLPTGVGDVTIPAPVSYLLDANGVRSEIKVKYQLSGKSAVRFVIPGYDKSETLVIDPIVMRWATWIASTTNVAAHCHGVDLDSAGNIYVVSRGGNGFMATVGEFQTTYKGDSVIVGDNLWISKYKEPVAPGESGTIIWQTYLGGTASTNPYACVVGPDGYLYIDGFTDDSLNTSYGTGAPAQNWAQRPTSVGQQCFVAKVAPNGAWAEVRDIGSAKAYLAPTLFDLRILPTGAGAFDLVAAGFVTQQASAVADGDVPVAQYPSGTQAANAGGSRNGYIFRLSSDLNTIKWAKQYTSTGTANEFLTTAIDAAGNIWLGGLTNGTAGISYNNPSTQTTLIGGTDGWLMAVDSTSGSALWSRYFNSSATNGSEILCMEANQQKTQFLIGGMTTGLNASNLPVASYLTTYPNGGQDFFVASIPLAANTTTWGTYFGGSASNAEDNMMGLNVDENNDVYVLGYTNSKYTPAATPGIVYNPVQNDSYDSTNYDAIFFKLSGAAGDSLLFYTFLGGKNNEEDPTGERGIKFNNCRIYLCITSESSDFPLTGGTFDSVYDPAATIYLPIIVSMANPPDLSGNGITGGGTQSIACGQAPQPVTASTPAYVIPTIIRNKTVQTNGTAGAYPNGVPVIANYQWQYSTNNGVIWTSISGATAQNYTPAAIDSFTGTYLLRRIINGDYCTLTGDTLAVVTVTPGPPPVITTNSPVCAGQTLTLETTAQTGFTYAWSGPSGFMATSHDTSIANASPSQVGTYYLTIKNTATGCASYPDSAPVIITQALPAPAAGDNSPVCAGDTVKLSATGAGNTFSWTGPDGFTSSLQNPVIPVAVGADSGIYAVTQSVGGACVSPPATVTVIVHATPVPVAGSSSPYCSGSLLNLTASTVQGATYSWTGPDGFTSNLQNPSIPNATVADSGTYTVTATVPGCAGHAAYVVVAVLNPIIANAGVDTQICYGDSVEIGTGLIEGQLYAWAPVTALSNPASANPVANPTQTTTYTLEVSDTSGCAPVTAHVTVTVNPLPVATAGPDDTIQTGGSVQLTGTGGVQYVWSSATGLSNANIFNPVAGPDSSTIYILTVTNMYGCQSTDTMEVYVLNGGATYWIPSAFTPNGDGHNDVLYVRGGAFLTFEFRVFNRYGEEIFDSKDMNEGWDGKTPNGQPAPMDAYVYKLNGVLTNGTTVGANGIVNLVR